MRNHLSKSAPGRFPRQTCQVLLGLLLLAGSGNLAAEIYKYKDEQGNWRFSDKKPAEKEDTVEVLDYEQKAVRHNQDAPANLIKHLNGQFPRDTVIQQTTLAVVSVHSQLGSGAGFFITPDGYLVTNRHVVRPASTDKWAAQQQDYETGAASLEAARAELRKVKEELDLGARELREFEKDLDYMTPERRILAEERMALQKRNQKEREARYRRSEAEISIKEAEFEKSAAEFNYASNLSRVAEHFSVTLKDNTELRLRLVALSEAHDLALLKLDGHLTPHLDIHQNVIPVQGETVFAVGSPLGMKDFVTSGIITHFGADSITTDAQILPGNSGGPLLREDGVLLGVNTQKILSGETAASEGFGVVIPIRFVLREFDSYLNKPQQ
ncbi:MAG: trypsin-like peptidase domain-containing protein [Gammaproteobacteria bacterium]|nr:trypsin-like peptidase domain-containing protein [Gammaproteobacteria bacterium]